MLEFRRLSLNDRDKVNDALRRSDFMGCEYSFANNLAWCRLADSRVCFYKDKYIVCAFGTEDGVPTFIFPSGGGDPREVIAEMMRFSESMGHPLRMCGVTEDILRLLGELYPGSFTSELDRDGCDYIYRREELAHFPGKKFHQKRNHLARFDKLDSEFSLITENDYDDCISFITAEYNGKADQSHSAVAEQYAVNTYFSHFEELGLIGGIIRIDGRIAAVTVGERLCSNTFCVHIEKADRQYEGIYTGICSRFVNSCTEGFEYINREEDLGIEGLRRSKLSYHPAFLLNKYIVEFKNLSS